MPIKYTLSLEENSIQIYKNHQDVVYQTYFDKDTNEKEELLDAYEMLLKLREEKFPTLREYIKENTSGAYHHFIFDVGPIEIDTIGIDEFEIYYNPKILDSYIVIHDIQQSSGSNCENYECRHYLKLESKEEQK